MLSCINCNISNVEHQKVGLYTSILAVISFIGLVVLLFSSNSIGADTNESYLGLNATDEEDDLIENITPMSCTYRGKLNLDTDTQSSLHKYQKILK